MMIRQHQLAKNSSSHETENKENCKFDQKPIKNFDDLSDGEQEEFKKHAEKLNAARSEKTEELKAKKLKVK